MLENKMKSCYNASLMQECGQWKIPTCLPLSGTRLQAGFGAFPLPEDFHEQALPARRHSASPRPGGRAVFIAKETTPHDGYLHKNPFFRRSPPA